MDQYRKLDSCWLKQWVELFWWKGERWYPSWPLGREKIIKKESTFPHSFLLLVSRAIKHVTVYAVRRRRSHAVCTLLLPRLKDLYYRHKNHFLSTATELTKAKKWLWYHSQNPTGSCKLLHSSIHQYSQTQDSCYVAPFPCNCVQCPRPLSKSLSITDGWVVPLLCSNGQEGERWSFCGHW